MRPSVPKATLAWPFVGLGGLILATFLYGPALHGRFIFDDLGLPFQLTLAQTPLLDWLRGTRPVLMFTYWLNHQLSGTEPFSYHLLNVLIHTANTLLVFHVLHRILELAKWTNTRNQVAALTGAAVFLAHPLATESVSYVAGRSESLAALLVLTAYVIFLYRREHGISWKDAAVIVALFVLGVAAKENAVALVGVFLLTDWLFPPRRTWRLYTLLGPGAVLAGIKVVNALLHGGNAGFSLREFTWYQYSFTQARAIFTYLRMAILPFGQSVDHDFPISRTVFEYGAWVYLIALALVIAVAVYFRRRYPLACFGLLMFLVWLAPTSSVVPILDPLVERRMYLPMIGLLLIACEVVSRAHVSVPIARSMLAVVLLLLGGLTYQRNLLWADSDKILEDAALQSIHNPRPVANLTDSLIAEQRCNEAFPWLERAARTMPDNYVIEASWGRALECAGRREEALQRLQRAVEIHPAFKLYEWIGLLYGEMNRLPEAGAAIRRAIELNPRAGSPHRSLALWHEAMHDLPAAANEYRTALRLDGNDQIAKAGLARVTALAPREPGRPQPTTIAP